MLRDAANSGFRILETRPCGVSQRCKSGRPCKSRLFRAGNGQSAAARDTLDLGPDNPLHHVWQIVVEPGLQHRPQHFLDQVFQRAGVVAEYGVCQRIEAPSSTDAIVDDDISVRAGGSSAANDGGSMVGVW